MCQADTDADYQFYKWQNYQPPIQMGAEYWRRLCFCRQGAYRGFLPKILQSQRSRARPEHCRVTETAIVFNANGEKH